LHVKPQEVPSHVAVAFSGGTQGVHEPPHVSMLVSSPQALPHAW
jgi:hypothetical protein